MFEILNTNVFEKSLLLVYTACVVALCLMCLSCDSLAQVTQLELSKESKIEFFDDNKGGIIAFESNNDVLKIKCSKESKEDVTCNLNYDFAIKSGNNIYIFSTMDKEVSVCSYSITKNQISNSFTYNLNAKSENDIAILKGGKIFFLSRISSRNIFSFISGKPKINGVAMKSKIRNIRSNPSGSFVYVQMDDDLGTVKVYDKTFSKQELGTLSNSICCDFEFVSDNLILDSEGNVFLKKVDSEFDFEKICSVTLDSKEKYKCFCKNYLVTSDSDDHIKLFDLAKPDVSATYECEGQVVYLSSYKDRIIVVEKIKGEYILKEMDIDDVVTPVKENFVPRPFRLKSTNAKEEQNSIGIVVNSSSMAESDSEDESKNISINPDGNVESLIVSNVYDIDLDRFVIKNVKFGTTVSKFNKNISLNGTDVKFVKNNKIISSGKVGTGTVLEFKDSENKTQKFTIVVKGDVTGSGNISSVDIREIYKHIFKSKLLDGFYLEAADINDDGKVDTLDLLAVSKLMD